MINMQYTLPGNHPSAPARIKYYLFLQLTICANMLLFITMDE